MKKADRYSIFSNMPTITTERLLLRSLHPMDAQDMYQYASRDDVTKYLLWSVHETVSYTADYLNFIQSRYALGDFFDWAVVEKDSKRMIGTCGFAKIDTANDCGELGYVLNPEFWGRGYAHEAASAVIEFGFQTLGLHRIAARFMLGNERSLSVMKRLGMNFEGYHTDEIFAKGEYKTIGYCAITRDEYFKLRCTKYAE